MKKNTGLLLLGAAAVGLYLLNKNKSDFSNIGGGGGGGGGENPPSSPETPFTPLAASAATAGAEVGAYSAPVIAVETQAAIDAGTLNIFGKQQITTPPTAPFITEYNKKSAAAKALTGNPNIAAPINVLMSSMPVMAATQEGINQIAQQAAQTKKANAAVTNLVNTMAAGPLSSVLNKTTTQSKSVSYVDKGTNLSIGQKRAMAAGTLKYR